LYIKYYESVEVILKFIEDNKKRIKYIRHKNNNELDPIGIAKNNENLEILKILYGNYGINDKQLVIQI